MTVPPPPDAPTPPKVLATGTQPRRPFRQQGLRQRLRGPALVQDRAELLEMIARYAPLPQILARLQAMVQTHLPGGACLVVPATVDRDRRPTLEDPAPEGHLSLDGWQMERACDFEAPGAPEPLRTWAVLRGLREGWSFPIIYGSAPFLGTILVGFPAAPPLAAREAEMMDSFARVAGMAIHQQRFLDDLSRQARYDPLTNLPNRALFRDRLQQAAHQADREGLLLALLFLDLDGFKHVNDTLGHPIGDQLLVDVAGRLQSLIRSSDVLCRLGGDEFAVILTAMKDASNASKVAQKCLRALGDPFIIQEHELFVGASIGISVFPQDARDADQLQRHADAAMYDAKARGRNGYAYYTSDLNQRAHERMEMEGLLRRALDNGEFLLHFQPQFRADGTLIGCEALLRWEHPALGMISPARFVPVAEENGLILPIGDWVLRESCRLMSGWHRRGHQGLSIAVNVSSLQFDREDFVQRVAEILASSGMDPRCLELELTESLVMQNPVHAARRLEALRELGVHIAVDDFGTGYSSLSYLQRLPLDTLKIDQSFVRDIFPGEEGTPSSAPIVEAIVALAKSLRLSLVAEGVETPEQLRFLRRLECEAIQGYLFSRPIGAQAFGAFLQQRNPPEAEPPRGTEPLQA